MLNLTTTDIVVYELEAPADSVQKWVLSVFSFLHS